MAAADKMTSRVVLSASQPWSKSSPRGPLVPVLRACLPSIASNDWYTNSPTANVNHSHCGAHSAPTPTLSEAAEAVSNDQVSHQAQQLPRWTGRTARPTRTSLAGLGERRQGVLTVAQLWEPAEPARLYCACWSEEWVPGATVGDVQRLGAAPERGVEVHERAEVDQHAAQSLKYGQNDVSKAVLIVYCLCWRSQGWIAGGSNSAEWSGQGQGRGRAGAGQATHRKRNQVGCHSLGEQRHQPGPVRSQHIFLSPHRSSQPLHSTRGPTPRRQEETSPA